MINILLTIEDKKNLFFIVCSKTNEEFRKQINGFNLDLTTKSFSHLRILFYQRELVNELFICSDVYLI